MRRQARVSVYLVLLWLCTSVARAQTAPASFRLDTAPAAKEPEIATPSTRDRLLAISPYLWLTGIAVATGKNSLHTDVKDIVKLLNVAYGLNVTAQYRKFGVVADYVWVKLVADTGVEPSIARLYLKENILDLRGSYRLLEIRAKSATDPSGLQLFLDTGTRFWKFDDTLTLYGLPTLPQRMGRSEGSISSSPAWWDWIVGARLLSTLSKNVHFALSANVGGFALGHSSRVTWQTSALAMFRLWKALHLDVGYRALQFKRDAYGGLPITKLTMRGLMLGLTLWF